MAPLKPLLLPHLLIKRRQAEILLAFLEETARSPLNFEEPKRRQQCKARLALAIQMREISHSQRHNRHPIELLKQMEAAL
ncbi:MAG: hypothetical protein ACREB9_02830 [Thermoplasmata archaeon]